MQEGPDGASAEVWKRATIALMGILTALLTAIGGVFVNGRRDKGGRRAQSLRRGTWEVERSGVRERVRTLEEEVEKLREWKQDVATPALTIASLLLDNVERLKQRVEELERE